MGAGMPTVDKEFDVVVVGSGGAGSAAASEAARHGARVLVISKDPLVCSDSKIAEGIVTVRGSGSGRDSERNLATNMRVEGGDIGDPALVDAFARDSIDGYAWLQRWGLNPLSKRGSGKPVSFALGGHNLPRSVPHPQGGLDYGHSIWNAILGGGSAITCIEDAWCLEVLTGGADRRVLGCMAYHAASGSLWRVRAPVVILACGGLSTLYFPNTDTMRGNTGDGYAIAARLGCELVDMEQVQFIPFGLVGPKSFEGLLVGEPASAGPLGVLRDREGRLLLTGIMRRTRAEVSAAIALAVAQGRGTERGGCYLDLTRNVSGAAGAMYYEIFNSVGHAFIKIMKAAHGPQAAEMKTPWEVRPTAHYCMGGLRVAADGETAGVGAIHGLLAAGQVLGGLHGGNRLGSTSLAEAVIFGLRAGRRAATLAQQAPADLPAWQAAADRAGHAWQSLHGRHGAYSASGLTLRLQSAAWKYFGPARTADGLRRGLAEVAAIRGQLAQVEIGAQAPWNQHLIDAIELDNLLTVAEAIGRSALERDASLGAHIRADAPRRDWLNRRPYSVVARQQAGVWTAARLPRPATPLPVLLAHKAGKAVALQGLDLLHRLPQPYTERILAKAYRRKAAEMGVTLAADIAATPETAVPLRLHRRIAETHDTVTFQFKAETSGAGEAPMALNFLPGQFGNFSFTVDGQELQRSYSFSSAPSRPDTVDITVKREPGGRVSNWIIDHLQPGDPVSLKAPRGKFHLAAQGGARKLLLIGAGSGITPLMSMLRWIVDTQAAVDVVLIHCARTPADLIFGEEIAGLGARHPRLRTCLTYTGAAADAGPSETAGRGRLDAALIARWVPDLAQRHAYTCGPAGFMDGVQQILSGLGLPKRKLHRESFSAQVDLSAFAGGASFKVEFARSAVTVDSVPGLSLLDLADRQNLDSSFSCRSGTCGECKTRLLDGKVHMVCEDGLDAAARREGYVLTCTAVPLSDCRLQA